MRHWMFAISIGLIACCKNEASGPRKESAKRDNNGKDTAVENIQELRQMGENAMDRVNSVKYLENKLGNLDMIIFKVADAKRRPAGEYIGKAEFEKVPGEDMMLLYIVTAATAGNVTLSQSKGGQWVNLPASNRVYRMPNSPFFTYAIVDFSKPVAVGLATVQGMAKVELPVSDLLSLSLHWSGEAGAISWQGIPSHFYESMSK